MEAGGTDEEHEREQEHDDEVAGLPQFANYYLGYGDLIVVLLLALVLLVRPTGLLGRAAA